MQPAQRRFPRGEGFQFWDGSVGPAGFSAPLDEQPLSSMTPPRIGMTQVIDQLDSRCATQVKLSWRESAFRSDAINPAAIFAGAQVKFIFDLLGNVIRMFDDVA